MALPNDRPTMTPPTSPGPAVAATPSRSRAARPASLRARATMASMASTWARAAISGTTPPYGACLAIWLSTTEEATSTPPSPPTRTTAAAVSSQLVSMPKTVWETVRALRATWSCRDVAGEGRLG
jgi:hypothetical protein